MRYAIYYTPPADDAFTRCGAEWLGRDAFNDSVFNVPSERIPHIATPARYGFHATLKAPFELAEGLSFAEIRAAFEGFCARQASLHLGPMTIQWTGNGFVLGLAEPSDALNLIAARIVEHFDPFRAPLSDRDIARRDPQRLSQRQRDNLDRWGYPHVMDDFRFHMTLTGAVPNDQRESVKKALEVHFSPSLGSAHIFGGLGLFVEPARGENFRVALWHPFKGS